MGPATFLALDGGAGDGFGGRKEVREVEGRVPAGVVLAVAGDPDGAGSLPKLLQTLERALATQEVNPAYVDDGMRYLIYKWAEAEEAALPLPNPGLIDQRLREAAELISYCVLGPAETLATWDAETCAVRRGRFEAGWSTISLRESRGRPK